MQLNSLLTFLLHPKYIINIQDKRKPAMKANQKFWFRQKTVCGLVIFWLCIVGCFGGWVSSTSSTIPMFSLSGLPYTVLLFDIVGISQG